MVVERVHLEELVEWIVENLGAVGTRLRGFLNNDDAFKEQQAKVAAEEQAKEEAKATSCM
jgi:hypothetical protein